LNSSIDFLRLNSLDFIRSGAHNGRDAMDERLIIVYGIQRTDVKNCFLNAVSCDPMDRVQEGQKFLKVSTMDYWSDGVLECWSVEKNINPLVITLSEP